MNAIFILVKFTNCHLLFYILLKLSIKMFYTLEEESANRLLLDPSIQAYHQYFQDVEHIYSKLPQVPISKQELHKHNIKLLTEQELIGYKNIEEGNSYVQYLGDEQDGLVCTYQVLINKFLLVVKLLNLHRNSEDESQSIGRGAYGIVKKVDLGDKKYAIKKIKFTQWKQQISVPFLIDPDDYSQTKMIRQAIKQYCIYKICSLFKIGPQIIFQNHYDVICYNDCIQFHMELCESVENYITSKNSKEVTSKNYREDIKLCIRVLHSINFVHMDIKPQNILYSLSKQKYVLCDFGVTRGIREKFDQRTETYFAGTLDYASPDLKKLFETKKKGFVNLYFNDLYSMEMTLRLMDQRAEYLCGSYRPNSLSQREEQSWGHQSYNSYNEMRQQQEQVESQVPPQQGSTGEIAAGNSTSMSENLNLIRFSHEINYYQMKVIYNFLLDGDRSKQFLKHITGELVLGGQNADNLRKTVYNIVEELLFCSESEKCLRSVRNCIRVFGMKSREVVQKLEGVVRDKKIPSVKQEKIVNCLKTLKRYQSTIKNQRGLMNLYININRSQFLYNRGFQMKSIHQLLDHYFRHPTKDHKISKIISLSLDMLVNFILPEQESLRMFYKLQLLGSQKSNHHVTDGTSKIIPKKKYYQNQQVEIIKKIEKMYWENFKEEDEHELPRSLRHFGLFYLFKEDELVQFEEFWRIVGLIRQKRQDLMKRDSLSEYEENCMHQLFRQEIYLCLGKKESKMAEQTIITLFSQLGQKITNLSEISVENFLSNIKNPFTRVSLIQEIMKLALHKHEFSRGLQLNKICLQMKKQVFFPLTTGRTFSESYFYDGWIYSHLKKYEKAIRSYNKCLQSLSENIRSPSYAHIVIESLQNMFVCYRELGKMEQGIKYMESAYLLSNKINFLCSQKTIVILQHLIDSFLMTNHCGPVIHAYIDQLFYLKINFIEKWQLAQQNEKCYQFSASELIEEKVTKEYYKQEVSIFVSKSIVRSIEPYLPKFRNCYIRFCLLLLSYYHSKNRTQQSLQYQWKFFKFANIKKKQENYHLVMDYINCLVRSQSSRRAIIFMKKQIKNIPDELKKFEEEFYKKLWSISRDLETKDRKYYSFVWKKKPFESEQNYQECLKEVEWSEWLKRWEKYVWIKKLKIFQRKKID